MFEMVLTESSETFISIKNLSKWLRHLFLISLNHAQGRQGQCRKQIFDSSEI